MASPIIVRTEAGIQGEQFPDGEVRVLDVHIAEMLGFDRPRDIRKLIKRHRALLPEILVRATVARGRNQHGLVGPEIATEENWLTVREALFIASQSDTPEAKLATLRLIDEYIALKALVVKLLAEQTPAPPSAFPADFAHGPRVGDLTTTKAQLKDECQIAANASGRSVREIHGYLRKRFWLSGIYHLSMFLLPNAIDALKEIATRRLLLPTKRGPVLRLVARDPRQPTLPHVETGATAVTPSNGGPA